MKELRSYAFIFASYVVLLMTLALAMVSCGGKDVPGPAGPTGSRGAQGPAGSDGSSAISDIYRITVDRAATPWSDNNRIIADVDGVLQLPRQFEIPAISNNENGGWFDFVIGDVVYCYQGRVGTKRYEFSYVKTSGATTGCDTNSDKSTDMVSFFASFKSGDVIQVIPRAPRYDVVEEFEFPYVGVE